MIAAAKITQSAVSAVRISEKGKPDNEVYLVKGTSLRKIAQKLTVKTDDNNTLSVRPEKGNNVFVYASWQPRRAIASACARAW